MLTRCTRSDFRHPTTWAPSAQLAFAHLNLRKNPFGALTIAESQRLAEVDLAESAAFLSQPTRPNAPSPAVQFMGRQGSGKTTHLLAMLAAIPGAVYSSIPIGEPPAIRTDGDPVLIDDAQWLTRRLRKHLFRGHLRLVLATHRDYSSELLHAGRPLLTLSSETTADSETLCRRLNARIEAVRRGPGRIPVISQHTASLAWIRHGPDMRSVLGRLFHIFQQLHSLDEPWFFE